MNTSLPPRRQARMGFLGWQARSISDVPWDGLKKAGRFRMKDAVGGTPTEAVETHC
jgi:hypothetical protein